MERRPAVTIIGSGNVATHLALALDAVADVVQAYSRNYEHASELASRLRRCVPISAPDDIDRRADYCIIAVADDAIAEVVAAFPRIDGIVAHTSGSVPMEVLSPLSARIGVFYPLQTFSKSANVDVAQAPFFIEGSDPQTLDSLMSLASMISGRVEKADSRQRAALHLAAVFACNFANHLWSISDQLLRDSGYDLGVLRPLLEATVAKAMSMPPAQAQTGPAARGDLAVMRKQMDALDPNQRQLYRTISQSILDQMGGDNPLKL